MSHGPRWNLWKWGRPRDERRSRAGPPTRRAPTRLVSGEPGAARDQARASTTGAIARRRDRDRPVPPPLAEFANDAGSYKDLLTSDDDRAVANATQERERQSEAKARRLGDIGSPPTLIERPGVGLGGEVKE